MDWYYAVDRQQVGPLPEEEFERLAAEGTIRAATLVWHEGMAQWLPYEQAYARQGAEQGAEQPAYEPARGARGFCCQCGRMASIEDMVAYQDKWVCAECKTLFFQRIREGVSLQPGQPLLRPTDFRYAGFWIRFAAVLIDGVAMWIVNMVLGLAGTAVAGFETDPIADPLRFWSVNIVVWLIQMGLAIWYETFMIGKYGATLGKLACGLRVIMPDGRRVTYARAFGRWAAKILSGLTLYIGYIIAGFDSQKRALHDHICSTRVIWK